MQVRLVRCPLCWDSTCKMRREPRLLKEAGCHKSSQGLDQWAAACGGCRWRRSNRPQLLLESELRYHCSLYGLCSRTCVVSVVSENQKNTVYIWSNGWSRLIQRTQSIPLRLGSTKGCRGISCSPLGGSKQGQSVCSATLFQAGRKPYAITTNHTHLVILVLPAQYFVHGMG